MALNLSTEDIDAIAEALSGKLAAQQQQAAHDAKYGPDFNWKEALEREKAQGEFHRIQRVLTLKNMLNYAGPINHSSGQGGNTGLADKFLPDGDWWVGTDRNGVVVRVGFASEQYIAASKPANPWRNQCVVELPGGRYNEAFQTIIDGLNRGFPNPTADPAQA